METGRNLAIRIVLVSLFILPILGLAILAALRRSAELRKLAGPILWVAAVSSVVTTCFGFLRSSMPIRPYETSAGYPWRELVGSMLTLAYVGFGIGSVMASAVAVPAALIGSRVARRRNLPTGDGSSKSPPEPGKNTG